MTRTSMGLLVVPAVLGVLLLIEDWHPVRAIAYALVLCCLAAILVWHDRRHSA